MAKKKHYPSNFILPLLLVCVPVFIMVIMSFGRFDANEYRIISIAAISEVVVYAVYKLIYFSKGNKF